MAYLRISFVAGLASFLFLSGCSPHSVRYPLSADDIYQGGKIGGSLKVEKFADEAPKPEKSLIRAGRRTWRTTAISGYRDSDRSGELSKAVARHLEHADLFDSVHYAEENPAEADYNLSGKIYDYNATGQVQPKAEKIVLFGAMFGSLPGAAATLAGTASVKSEVNSNVELRDLEITNRAKTRVWSKASVGSRSDKTVHFLKADKKPLYREADERLKEVVSEVVDEIGELHKKTPSRWKRSHRSRR